MWYRLSILLAVNALGWWKKDVGRSVKVAVLAFMVLKRFDCSFAQGFEVEESRSQETILSLIFRGSRKVNAELEVSINEKRPIHRWDHLLRINSVDIYGGNNWWDCGPSNSPCCVGHMGCSSGQKEMGNRR